MTVSLEEENARLRRDLHTLSVAGWSMLKAWPSALYKANATETEIAVRRIEVDRLYDRIADLERAARERADPS